MALLLAALRTPPTALAQDAPPATPERPRLTSLDVGPLTRSAVVVLGTLRVLIPGEGGATKVARVAVEKTLWGRIEDKDLTIFIGGTRNSADPRRQDFLDGQREGRYVLFLARTQHASGYAVESVISAEGEEGAEKADVLEQELRIQALADDEERARPP